MDDNARTAAAPLAGRHLKDVDAALFTETMEALLRRDVSHAGASLDEDEIQIVAGKLRLAELVEKCGCGEPECNTYYFRVPEKPEGSVSFSTVRFYARGEHLLHIDSDGDIYQLQRLYDDHGPRTIFSRGRDGSWEQRRV